MDDKNTNNYTEEENCKNTENANGAEEKSAAEEGKEQPEISTQNAEDKNYPHLKKEQIKKIRSVLFVVLAIVAFLLIVFRDKL